MIVIHLRALSANGNSFADNNIRLLVCCKLYRSSSRAACHSYYCAIRIILMQIARLEYSINIHSSKSLSVQNGVTACQKLCDGVSYDLLKI